MSVKSTRYLTRDEAEERYCSLVSEQRKRAIRAEAVVMSDKELEDELERLNDLAHHGEGFENYWIRESSSK